MVTYTDLPPDFIARVKKVTPGTFLDQVLESYTVKRPTTFRANTLKITSDDLIKELEIRGISAQRMSWYPDAFVLLHEESRVLTESDLYNEGKIYVQSLSSMIPSLILDPLPGELILDLCAAPGSKTTQIAAMMKNEGLIIANDLSTVRLYKLAHNLKLQGVTIAKTRRGKGEDLWKEVQRRHPFDRVLADVPCSLEGRFTVLDPRTYDGWSEKKVEDLAQRMRYLLWSAVQSVKPGGFVVYSTCTISPEENEGVVDWVLGKEQSRIELVDVQAIMDKRLPHHGFLTMPGLLQWNQQRYSPLMVHTCRIFPTQHMEGFFVALLRRSELD